MFSHYIWYNIKKKNGTIKGDIGNCNFSKQLFTKSLPQSTVFFFPVDNFQFYPFEQLISMYEYCVCHFLDELASYIPDFV